MDRFADRDRSPAASRAGSGPRINRPPGSFARERVARLRLRTLVVLGGLAVGTAYLGRTFGLRDPIYLTSELTLLLAILIVTHSVLPLVHRHERGARGEEVVGRLLETLTPFGYHVLHDVDLGRGNIDHLLVGPGGIFTVETKSHPGPITVRRIHGGALEQARAQQRLVESLTGEAVRPLLVYSRAWVDRPLARRKGVTVLPARYLPRLLEGAPPILDEREVARALQRVVGAARRRAGSGRRFGLRWRDLLTQSR